MSRHARLKPRKTNRATPWEISIPPHMSATGKRERRYFETKEKAEWEIESIRDRRLSFGETLEKLTPARAAESLRAYKLLEGHNATLLDVVTEWLKIHRDRTASTTFVQLYNEFLEAKKDRSPKYLTELRITRDRWPNLHPLVVSDITHRTLSPIIGKLSRGARNPVLRYWRAVFNYGIKRGYLAENPVNGLDFERRRSKEVETLSVPQVRKMLEHALEHDLRLLPYVCLGVFCGCRPEGELTEVEWRDIDLDDRVVTIRPEVSKTHRRRFIELSENAVAWLRVYIDRGGITTGRIVPMTGNELRGHRRANWKAAGITKWTQQVMRHSYCSNWLAKHGDVNKLVLMSGHDSVETLWRHYHRGTPKTEAGKYWDIRPSEFSL